MIIMSIISSSIRICYTRVYFFSVCAAASHGHQSEAGEGCFRGAGAGWAMGSGCAFCEDPKLCDGYTDDLKK